MTTPATSFSFSRVGAMVRRYWYLLRSSWPRLLERYGRQTLEDVFLDVARGRRRANEAAQ